jgi:hypothetical protein
VGDAVERLAVGARALCLAHARDGVDRDVLDPRQRPHRGLAVGLDLGLERAGGRGQDEGEGDGAVGGGDVLDHPQRDQVAVQVGVLNRAQGSENIFASIGSHAHSG